MELLAAIHERRATRDFETSEVSRSDLSRLIDAALWAPSAMNGQPWHFTVVTDRALLKTISNEAKTWFLGNPPRGADNERLKTMLRDPNFHIFHNAPALIVISAPDDEAWCAENCALAAQNLMLAATELALGTCWIGFAQGWLNTPDGHKALRLAPRLRVVAPIIVGYPRRLTAACLVHRKSPDIVWIAPERGSESSRPEAGITHGVYGTLIHP